MTIVFQEIEENETVRGHKGKKVDLGNNHGPI